MPGSLRLAGGQRACSGGGVMKATANETYVSVDIESDGPIPGANSMLSFGAAAFHEGELTNTHTANLHLLSGAVQDPATMAWWRGQGDAYETTRKDLAWPEQAMERFVQ